jgi:hypothetical protein
MEKEKHKRNTSRRAALAKAKRASKSRYRGTKLHRPKDEQRQSSQELNGVIEVTPGAHELKKHAPASARLHQQG